MKVKDLIIQLQEIVKISNKAAEAEVIMSSDAEGNTYSPLSDISDGLLYEPNNTWSGEIYSTLGAEDGSEEVEELSGAIPASAIPAIVLFPTN